MSADTRIIKLEESLSYVYEAIPRKIARWNKGESTSEFRHYDSSYTEPDEPRSGDAVDVLQLAAEYRAEEHEGGSGVFVQSCLVDAKESIYRVISDLAQRRDPYFDSEHIEIDTSELKSDFFVLFGPMGADLQWRVNNRRRVELIMKRVADSLSDDERAELDELQAGADARMARVVPRDTLLLDTLEKKFNIQQQ